MLTGGTRLVLYVCVYTLGVRGPSSTLRAPLPSRILHLLLPDILLPFPLFDLVPYPLGGHLGGLVVLGMDLGLEPIFLVVFYLVCTSLVHPNLLRLGSEDGLAIPPTFCDKSNKTGHCTPTT